MIGLGLWIFAILDVVATDEVLVRNLPKMAWLFLVILVPTVGAIAWLALGRPMYAGWLPGDTRRRSPGWSQRQVRGPEDSDEWNRRNE